MSTHVLVSVVVPTKNEEISISTFLEWCFEGFSNSNVDGEVILMDSSTDMTAEIARKAGATVIHVDAPGLGNAYLQAKGKINGKIVILGDADCTYDFREIDKFIKKIDDGFDLVMGSRFKGNIEKGAMPPHHQFFGSPGTTFVFRLLTGLKLTDIHCGMRALKTEHFEQLPFLEHGWEYATEMIVASHNLGGKIGEIPIAFFKEPEGRTSHHKRSGWMSPFKAGWGTLKTTCTYSLDRILLVPGLLLGLISYTLAVARVTNLSMFNDLGIGSSAGTAFVGLSMAGFSAFALGLIAGCLYDQTGRKISNWNRRLAKIPFFGLTVMSSFILLVNTVLTIDSWISFNRHGREGEFTATQSWIFSLGTLFNLFIFSATHLLIIYLGKNRTQFVNGA
jgi:glycosyltransferase involved in cell wall biosynthesis